MYGVSLNNWSRLYANATQTNLFNDFLGDVSSGSGMTDGLGDYESDSSDDSSDEE